MNRQAQSITQPEQMSQLASRRLNGAIREARASKPSFRSRSCFCLFLLRLFRFLLNFNFKSSQRSVANTTNRGFQRVANAEEWNWKDFIRRTFIAISLTIFLSLAKTRLESSFPSLFKIFRLPFPCCCLLSTRENYTSRLRLRLSLNPNSIEPGQTQPNSTLLFH